jgi:enhancing lycopene biosynthesis protein 2
MKKIAVILAGAGYLDGAEITETTSTLIHLSKEGADYQVFAPNVDLKVVDHMTGKETGETRNVLSESARISRGNVQDLNELNPNNFDAVVMPGGYGVAKNLSTFAYEGPSGKINPKLNEVLNSFFEQSKPIGAICISPAVVSQALGDKNPVLTIGNDTDTAQAIEKLGGTHEECVVTDYISDRENKILSTPAYMYDAKPHEVFEGIGKLVKELVEMA